MYPGIMYYIEKDEENSFLKRSSALVFRDDDLRSTLKLSVVPTNLIN